MKSWIENIGVCIGVAVVAVLGGLFVIACECGPYIIAGYVLIRICGK